MPAPFSFKPLPGRSICELGHAETLTVGKPFIHPFPSSGTIEPGKEVVIKVVMLVDEEWAARMTLGAEDMNGGF